MTTPDALPGILLARRSGLKIALITSKEQDAMSQTDFLPTPYEPPYPDDAPISPREADRLASLLPTWLYNVADRPVVAKDMRTVPTVLIVDDDQSIGYLLSMLLSESGFQAKVVQNAEDAFQAACDDQPALMLID